MVKAGRWAVDADSLFNQQATWSQAGDGENRFTLAGELDNSDGTIETQSLLLSAGQLVNQRAARWRWVIRRSTGEWVT